MSALDTVEEYLVRQVAGHYDEDDEQLTRAAGFVATVGAQRWGVDLERDAGDQRYAHLNDALEDAMGDLAAGGYLPITGEVVTESARQFLDIIEEEGGFDVHEPGPLAVPIEEADSR